MAKKKKRTQNKSNLSLIVIALILVVALYISGMSPSEALDYLFGTKQSQVTEKAPESTSGDNPGPIEHGKATFTKDELKNDKKGWIHYGDLDQLGRPTTAEALITPQMIGTGTGASQDIRPPGFISGKAPHNHSRGHLIGRQLGGSGEDLKNLVTLYQNPVNTPYMTKYENMVRQAADNGETIRYRVTPVYEGNIGMPIAVDMEGKSLNSNTIDFHVTIENKK